MSTVDLVAEVIEEVYHAERFLEPGKLPDKRIFKHLKTLWQLLLGINEADFDSHNYDVFELVFIDEYVRFTGFVYLGDGISRIGDSVINAVGSPTESLNNVHILDQDNRKNEETSISSKLSVLNKIRYLLYEHHFFVDALFDESKIVSVIESYLRTDILNTSKDLSVSLRTNSEIFDTCYQDGLLELFHSDERINLEEMCKRILNIFKLKVRLAYFFDSKLLFKYVDQIKYPIKQIFKKHSFVNEEIDDYFLHNPILPILKPIYRKIQNTPAEETLGNMVTNSKLKIDLLEDVLREVSENEIDQYQEIPITLKWFSQIVHHYCNSLRDEGVDNIENDLFITLIKNTVIKWIERVIDTPTFITQLSDLSLIPTAMPYTLRGEQMPTVHMRKALYEVKESIRLKEVYFEQWHSKTHQSTRLRTLYENCDRFLCKKYFGIFKTKSKKIGLITQVDTSTLSYLKLKLIFSLWRRSYRCCEQNLEISISRSLKPCFDKWKNATLSSEDKREKAHRFYSRVLLKKYMRSWVAAKMDGYIDVETAEKINRFRKKVHLRSWRLSWNHVRNEELVANKFHYGNCTRLFFEIWKTRATLPLAKLQLMDEMAVKFIVRKQFDIWKRNMKLLSLKKLFYLETKKQLMGKYFGVWYHMKCLNLKALEISDENARNLKTSYFKAWSSSYQRIEKADAFSRKILLSSFFHYWKSKYTCEVVYIQFQNNLLKKYFFRLKMAAISSQYHQRNNYLLIHKYFATWNNNTLYTNKLLATLEQTYPILQMATYFDFWKGELCRNQEFNRKAGESVVEFVKKSELRTKAWMLNILKRAYRDLRLKRLNLKRIETLYQSEIMLPRYFKKFKQRTLDQRSHMDSASNYYKLLIEGRCFDIWLAKFDKIETMNGVLYSKLDGHNAELLINFMSKIQLRMIKTRTDNMNADKFKERWDKLKTATFFELWKYKLSSRTSPTPTARQYHHYSDINKNNQLESTVADIPELNPYIDLGPKSRGSPEVRPHLQSRMRSLLTGEISNFEVQDQVSESDLLSTPYRLTPSRFRTPIVRKSASRLLQSSNLLLVDTNNLTSTERVRKRNLEERVSKYRLLKSPPKTKLDKVIEESNGSLAGNNINGRNDENIFDPTFDNLENNGTSTPVRT